MKIQNERNSNGNFKTIETTPNDGFVPEKVIHPANTNAKGNYHKGYTKTIVYSTNNPKITRPFAYGIFGLFFVIGLFTLLIGLWYFTIPFIGISIFGFIKSKKDIDKIAEKLKNKGHDVTIDSDEEKEQLKKEIAETFKDKFKESTSTIFTKDRYNWFIKISITIYCITAAIIVLLICFFINILLGLFLLIISTLVGFLYYYLISKLFKN